MFNWKTFLQQWVATSQNSDAPASIQPGAAEADLLALEARLGKPLPPSYRTFLLESNGFINLGHSIDRLRPAHEVDWFAQENQELIDIWVVPEMVELDPATEHLKTVLQISDEGDIAFLLLNPNVIDPATGEWEAWFFAEWVPGWDQYPSFQHLIENQYQTFLYIQADKIKRQNVARAPQDVKDALGSMADQWQHMADQMRTGLSDTYNMDTLLKMMIPDADQRANMQSHIDELKTMMDSSNQRMMDWWQASQSGEADSQPPIISPKEAEANAAKFQDLMQTMRTDFQAASPKIDEFVLPDLGTLNDTLMQLGMMQGLNMAAGQLRQMLNTPPDPSAEANSDEDDEDV